MQVATGLYQLIDSWRSVSIAWDALRNNNRTLPFLHAWNWVLKGREREIEPFISYAPIDSMQNES
jgi:ribosome biogenesis protein Tsr3